MNQTIEHIYQLYIDSTGVSTDSRKISKDNLYVALKGPNFNGNRFAKNALDAGASYCIVDEPVDNQDNRIILVKNALVTLQQLARYHRRMLKIPVIAICGSNGKTTTKELTGRVLKTTYNVFVTQGNLNNHIGVPLTLLSLDKQHQMVVLEIGANHLNETALLCEIAEPDFGLITNNGKDHLEGYGSIDMVRKGNGEFYDYVRKFGGHIFVSAWQNDLMNASNDLNRTIYGNHKADIIGKIIPGDLLHLEVIINNNSPFNISTQLVGDYNTENVLAAVAIGNYFNVSTTHIIQAIESYVPGNNRSQMVLKSSNKIIVDCYNANPSSMELAIKNLSKYPGEKVLIAGDMYELGSYSYDEHIRILQLARDEGIEHIWIVGAEFTRANDSLHIAEQVFDNTDQLRASLSTKGLTDKTILIKGSRAMRLENVLDII